MLPQPGQRVRGKQNIDSASGAKVEYNFSGV
jgi:hypothetical protein